MDLRHDYDCQQRQGNDCTCGVDNALHAQAEIARLTSAHDTVCGALAQAITERDTARAETAMAFGVAANRAQAQFLPSTIGGDLICDAEQGECTANAIRRLTPADATAALAARDKAMLIEGMRRAATIKRDPKFGNDWLGMTAAILALIEKETGA